MNPVKISVVIPCRNENDYVAECIHAIFASKMDENVQLSVFLVDGMSDDGTRDTVVALQKAYPRLRLIDNPLQLTPFAFNLGIKAETCDYVQIIGARHIVSENYIAKCLQILQNDSSTYCVGGKIENQYINKTGKIIAAAMSTSLGMGIGNFRVINDSAYVDTVGTPMYPAWVFDKIGYFDEELVRNQDDEFNFRLTKAGGKIWYESSIALKYYVRGSFNNLWKQFYQYGYWKVYVNQKHKAVTTYRQLVPPAFVVYLSIAVFSFLFGVRTGIVFSLPLLMYVALACYVTLDLTSKDKSLPFLKVFQTFPILHISYGSGYLKGMLDFILLRKKPSEQQKTLSR